MSRRSGREEAMKGRLQYALQGSSAEFRAAAPDPDERMDWAYRGVKSFAAYQERLLAENDHFVLGELVERAWGTQLLSKEILHRAWQVGGRARLSASLDPRCEEELAEQWFAGWLGGSERHWVMND